MLLRRIGIMLAASASLLCFSQMQSLWRWYPLDPLGTGRAPGLKRLLDPFAITGMLAAFAAFAAFATFILSLPGMTEQLRKEPFPLDMWTSLPLLKRPGGVVLCCLGAAIAVVYFR
jgi:hypothetical protein